MKTARLVAAVAFAGFGAFAACGSSPAARPAATTPATAAATEAAIAPAVSEPIEPMPAAAEPMPPKDPVTAAVERNVGLYEAIAAVEPTTPCPQAAAAIDRLIADRADALRTVRAAARSERGAEVDALFSHAAGRLGSALARIESLSQRCAGEPGVNAALGRLSGGGQP